MEVLPASFVEPGGRALHPRTGDPADGSRSSDVHPNPSFGSTGGTPERAEEARKGLAPHAEQEKRTKNQPGEATWLLGISVECLLHTS